MVQALSDVDIYKYFDKPKLRNKFGGCIARDEVDLLPRGKCYIINLVGSNQSKMGHWMALSDLNPKCCIYFDSFGMPPPNDIADWMKRGKKECIYSTLRIQKINSVLCGYYAIDVLLSLIKDPSLDNFINTLYLMKNA